MLVRQGAETRSGEGGGPWGWVAGSRTDGKSQKGDEMRGESMKAKCWNSWRAPSTAWTSPMASTWWREALVVEVQRLSSDRQALGDKENYQ